MSRITDIIRLGLNEKLKQAKTYEDIVEIEEDILELNYHDMYFNFKMKKSGYTPFHFSKHYSNEKVSYLINDGVSVGKSMVKNLHRNIEIV